MKDTITIEREEYRRLLEYKNENNLLHMRIGIIEDEYFHVTKAMLDNTQDTINDIKIVFKNKMVVEYISKMKWYELFSIKMKVREFILNFNKLK